MNNKISAPISCDEFRLRLSKGTDKIGTDTILTTKDFQFVSKDILKNNKGEKVIVKLKNAALGLQVMLTYELKKEDFFMHKQLVLKTDKAITIERIDVESMAFEDAYQPYTLRDITAYAKNPPDWKPGLGQPLYTKNSGTFWGIEFPAATNYVKNSQLNCGYLSGEEINSETKYISYKSVLGVADEVTYIDEAFYKYIDQIRVRPLRLQIQYNSWFDYGNSVSQDLFLSSVDKVNEELVEKRNCHPLSAYVIDDGWEDSFSDTSDWSDGVWKTNRKFDQNFGTSLNKVKDLHSKLGLWLSPGVMFGSNRMLKKMKEEGYETLENSMSLSGPKYMSALKKRLLNLTKEGVSYYKFDGLFGHLYQRDFELQGRGTPAMPQLSLYNIKPGDSLLNDPKYDELKTYYLVSGTEKLIDIFDSMARINPQVFITISNGAYLSPWWLQHVDAIWMINAGDAAKGSTRTEELTYRDGIYYEIWKKENTKFPMNAIFNHEPKKIRTGEPSEDFKKYLLMNFSRGTGLIELYLKTKNLNDQDWDVLAETLKWTYHVFPTFKNIHMHGGNPTKKEPYGYSAWDDHQGYVSVHNPSNNIIKYKLKLDQHIGLKNTKDSYHVSSPLADGTVTLNSNYTFGNTIEIEIDPKDIKILNFSTAQ